MKVVETQMVVIGAGPGGYTAAFYAADKGMKTALVERQGTLGGVCLNVGCIPSKALLHMAAIKEEAEKGSEYGLNISMDGIDLEKMRLQKEKIVQKLTGGLKVLSKARNVDVYNGHAKFLDANNLIITDAKGEETRLTFQKALIAAGSRPIKPSAFDFSSDRIFTSTGALELKDIPKSLLIVGGGIIGLELGSFYATFGSEVTVVEALDSLVSDVDRDVFRHLERKIKKMFKNIHLNTMVQSLKANKNEVVAVLKTEKGEVQEKFSRALVSIGRMPNSDALDLGKANISIDDKGFVKVDKQMRTSSENIFAIGDIVGNPMLAHKASREAHIAIDAAMGKKVAFENICIPNVIYTDPELAWVGLTEKIAKEKNISYKIGTFPWAASGRALAIGKTEGMTKLLFDPKTERILGAAIVGASAGELIAETTLAIEMGAVMEDISETIHAHPTLSETTMESAEDLHALATHFLSKNRK